MAVRMYHLIQTDIGLATSVVEDIRKLDSPYGRLVSVDRVTGPYDLIVMTESKNLDHAELFIRNCIQKVKGVDQTTTCIAIQI